MRTGKIKLFEGKSKKTGEKFTALELSVGDWTALYFPQSRFEMNYIEKTLRQEIDNELDLESDD